MRSSLAKHEWALVAGIMIVYFHVLSLAIPAIPHVPLLFIGPTILTLLAMFLYGLRYPPFMHLRLYARSYQSRFLAFILATGLMLIYGIVLGNGYFYLGTELTFFLIFSLFLLIGGHDRVWYVLDRPTTIMVYVTFALMFIFKDTVVLQQRDGAYEAHSRLINTVAYGLRPMMAPAVFVFIWGCVNTRSRLWKLLQVGTIVPWLLSDVGLFQFRSTLVVVLLAVFLVLVIYPLLQNRRVRHANYILICAMAIAAFAFFLRSDYWTDFMTRVYQVSYRQTSIFASRQIELEVFFNQMGADVIWGRGLGGYFDASSVFLTEENSDRWRTVHIGIFSLVLRGGGIFLAIFLSFFLPFFRRKHPQWYNNPCNVASVLSVPVILIHLSTAPFIASISLVTRYLWFALVMARLGTVFGPMRRRFLAPDS